MLYDLKRLQIIAGLTDIGLDCPGAPSVGLAVDPEGGLHLASVDLDDSRAVTELMQAQAWARSHAVILQRAEPKLNLPIEPVAHLITRNTDQVRALIETTIRVHVMAPASSAVQGWVVSAVND